MAVLVAVHRLDRARRAVAPAVLGEDESATLPHQVRGSWLQRQPIHRQRGCARTIASSAEHAARLRRGGRTYLGTAGTEASWLGEAFVHGEDIRRPLGIVRAYPLEAVVLAIEFYARSNLVIGGRDRIAGLRLNAEDAGHQIGDGVEVRGPAISLLLAAAWRPVAVADLDGPGLPLLASRC
jgi:hypothetical protein